MGSRAEEGVERLLLEEARLACERSPRRKNADVAFKRVSGDHLVCWSSIWISVRIAISPDVPAGPQPAAMARRKHPGFQQTLSEVVRQCAAHSGTTPLGCGPPVVLVAMGGPCSPTGRPLPEKWLAQAVAWKDATYRETMRGLHWQVADTDRRRLGRGLRWQDRRRSDDPLQAVVGLHCSGTHRPWSRATQHRQEWTCFEPTFVQRALRWRCVARVPPFRFMAGPKSSFSAEFTVHGMMG